jgi:ATP phosphoribosyltransferase
VLCAEGAIDLGITGSDLVDEMAPDLTTRLSLGIGKCRLAICVPEEMPIKSTADLRGRRIATSFPNVTKRYLDGLGVEAHMVRLSGSVEIMVTLGVADAIVDLVETGSTLVANRLQIFEEIGVYETVVVQNTDQRQSDLADRILRRLEGVVIARRYSLLGYNIPRDRLDEAETITPGFNSPTINA